MNTILIGILLFAVCNGLPLQDGHDENIVQNLPGVDETESVSISKLSALSTLETARKNEDENNRSARDIQEPKLIFIKSSLRPNKNRVLPTLYNPLRPSHRRNVIKKRRKNKKINEINQINHAEFQELSHQRKARDSSSKIEELKLVLQGDDDINSIKKRSKSSDSSSSNEEKRKKNKRRKNKNRRKTKSGSDEETNNRNNQPNKRNNQKNQGR